MLKHVKTISILSLLILSLQISKPDHAFGGRAVNLAAGATVVSFIGLIIAGGELDKQSNEKYCPNDFEMDYGTTTYPCRTNANYKTCYNKYYFCSHNQTKVLPLTRYSASRETALWVTVGFAIPTFLFGCTTLALCYRK